MSDKNVAQNPWEKDNLEVNKDHLSQSSLNYLQIIKGTRQPTAPYIDDPVNYPKLLQDGMFAIPVAKGGVFGLDADNPSHGWEVITRTFDSGDSAQFFGNSQIDFAVLEPAYKWKIATGEKDAKNNDIFRDRNPETDRDSKAKQYTETRILGVLGNVPIPGEIILTSGASSTISRHFTEIGAKSGNWGLVWTYKTDMKSLTSNAASQWPIYWTFMRLEMRNEEGCWLKPAQGQAVQLPQPMWDTAVINGTDKEAQKVLLGELYAGKDIILLCESKVDSAKEWKENYRKIDGGEPLAAEATTPAEADGDPFAGGGLPTPENVNGNGETQAVTAPVPTPDGYNLAEQSVFESGTTFNFAAVTETSKSPDEVADTMSKWTAIFPDGKPSEDGETRVLQLQALSKLATGTPKAEVEAAYQQEMIAIF